MNIEADHQKILTEAFSRFAESRAKGIHLKIWLFGSRATGRNHAYSDADFVIESIPNAPLDLGDLKEELEESKLPFKVDLVKDEELFPEYRERFLRERILFYESA